MTKMLTSLEIMKPRLSGETYINLKNRLRERKKILSSIPRLRLLSIGVNASLSININVEDRIPLFLSDIQHLLLYSILGHHSPYIPERWCKLDKYNKIPHTIVFIIEGLSVDHYLSNESTFHHVTSKFEHRLELVTPTVYGGSVLKELINVPLTGNQKTHFIREFGSLENAIKDTGNIIKYFRTIFPIESKFKINKNTEETIELPFTDKFPRTKLILSPWQLIEENYPIPFKGFTKYADYVLTKDNYVDVHPKSQMFGLDCEMCQTIDGILELTRISIVDEKLNIIYDTLVKPYNKITNYLTQYSGITKKMLENVTTRLSDVQAAIRTFLPPDAILVGQSLNSDLDALKMMHPYIIDTSIIFNLSGKRSHKSKLKILVESFLNEKIQNDNLGHCSIEDSKASIKLVKLKLAKSLYFGDSVLIEQSNKVSTELYFKTGNKKFHLNEDQEYCTLGYTLGSSIFNHITKIHTKTAAIFGSNEVVNDYSRILKKSSLNIMENKNFDKDDDVRVVITQSNKETVSQCSKIAKEHNLNFCHIKLDAKQLSEENVNETLSSIDKWVRKLWKHTKLYSLMCVIFSGEKNSSNGACFLNIKNNIDTEF